MKTIIAGGRDVTQYSILRDAVANCGFKVTEVVCGLARGADYLGQVYAAAQDIPIHYYPADWDRFGKAAGYIRNKVMADNAEAAIVLWDGKSKGSEHMIRRATGKGLKVYVHRVDARQSEDAPGSRDVQP